MFDRILLWGHLVLGFCSFGRFLITVAISVLVIGLFIISISTWFSLGRLNFSKNLSVSSSLSTLLTYSCSLSLIIPCNSALSIVIFLFWFLIFLIWFFTVFFFISLAKGLSILFIFSKNQLLVLLIFTDYCFLHFFFISFCSDLYDFFPSINFFWGGSSFSSCFRCKVMLSIWCFSCFLR